MFRNTTILLNIFKPCSEKPHHTTHLVVIVQDDEPAEPKVTPQRTRLRGNPLLQAPVAADHVREVVHNLYENGTKKQGGGGGATVTTLRPGSHATAVLPDKEEACKARGTTLVYCCRLIL